MARRPVEPQHGEHVGQRQQPGKRRAEGGHQHGNGERPVAVLFQGNRAADQGRGAADAADIDVQERLGQRDGEQQQARDGERQGAAGRVVAAPAQHRGAARAARHGAARQRRHALQQPAIGAFAQARAGGGAVGCDGDGEGHARGLLAAAPVVPQRRRQGKRLVGCGRPEAGAIRAPAPT